MQSFSKLYIDGQFVAGDGNETVKVLHKYSQQEMASLKIASSEQIELSLDTAQKAFQALKKISAEQRYNALQHLAALVEDHFDEFVDIIVAEAGKPRSYAKSEVTRSIFTLRSAAAAALFFCGENVNVDMGSGEGMQAYTVRKPRGVVFAISPFNFPLNLALHKIAPALAVGCPVIIKPSSKTPLSVLRFAQLVHQIKLPRCSLQVLLCSQSQSDTIIKDGRIKFISFTGSDVVGWHIKSLANKKPVALELGGNGAALVGETADLDVAAKKLVNGAFLYAGQICISTQRIFVLKKNYAKLVDAMQGYMRELGLGDPDDPYNIVGPLIDRQTYKKVKDLVQTAVDNGAKIEEQTKGDESHNVFPATLLTNVENTAEISQQEAFAPIVIVIAVDSWSEGLAKINESRYGLQAGIFTHDLREIRQAHAELDVGGVIVNNPPGFRVDTMPYGGVKDSGFGREGPKYAMEEMTESCLLVF